MQQMQQYEKIRLATGRVENVVTQQGRYAVKIAGEWYSAFERACPVTEGQQVAIAFVENGRFRNIKAVSVLAEKLPGLSETVPRGFGPRDRFMTFAVALKAAASCYGSEVEVNSEAIKRLADTFAEWLISKSSGVATLKPTLCDCESCKCPKLKGTGEPNSLVCVSCGGGHA